MSRTGWYGADAAGLVLAAAGRLSGSRVRFDFDGGSKPDPQTDRHRHSAGFEFVGQDELRSTGTEPTGGKPAMVVDSHPLRPRDREEEAR